MAKHGHVTGLTSTQCYHPGPSRLRPSQTPVFLAQRCNAASLASSFQRPSPPSLLCFGSHCTEYRLHGHALRSR